MRPENDALDAVAGTGPAGIPTEYIEVLPVETQPTDFMTAEARPREVRPRERFSVSGS